MREFWEIYGSQILEAIMGVVSVALTSIIAYLGTKIKVKVEAETEQKIKKETAEIVVNAVQQMYDNSSAEEKLGYAIDGVTQMLQEKNIIPSDFEIRMLIENAVADFKGIWNK